MKALVFQVALKSDIVLPASSNTEGKVDTLDFIAGSNFLGMVAKNYDKFASSFDVFHSGKVRFGDGHILKYGKTQTYKIPYSCVYKKSDIEAKKIYNYHKLEEKDFEPEDKGGLGQLKQLRNGYITEELDEVFVNYTYSQKSARDKEKRTSKEGQMYGYTALKKGSVWQFVVKVDETISNEDEKLIIKTLQESKRLGKSKSAEYGEVAITLCESCPPEHNFRHPELDSGSNNSEVVLYCNSRLALVDEFGNPTYDLNCLCGGVEIIYEKTQIRTSTFTPYNGARQTKDYERVCINKGSVIVLKNIPTDDQLQKIQNGIGAFLSEGFGEIIINPSFLMKKEFPLQKECKDKKEKLAKLPITEDVVKFLETKKRQKRIDLILAKKVQMFINRHKIYKNIKPSQWGNIRSIATSNQENWLNNIEEYVSSGGKKWEDKQVRILMKKINNCKLDKQKFTKLLAMKMGGKND